MKILIADDDSITRRLLETILNKWGYQVMIAQDGDEAWRALQGENAPKLAILDWMMPGLDGVEICRRARQRVDSPYVYIMLLTSKIRKEDIIEGMDAGADDYLTKPFNRHELEVRLRAGLRILDLQEALLASADELARGRVRETEMGEQLRQTLLQADLPAMSPGLEVAAATLAGTELEGDFYDFFSHGDGSFDVLIGDVLGSGLSAALIAAATKNQFLRVLHRAAGRPRDGLACRNRHAGARCRGRPVFRRKDIRDAVLCAVRGQRTAAGLCGLRPYSYRSLSKENRCLPSAEGRQYAAWPGPVRALPSVGAAAGIGRPVFVLFGRGDGSAEQRRRRVRRGPSPRAGPKTGGGRAHRLDHGFECRRADLCARPAARRAYLYRRAGGRDA